VQSINEETAMDFWLAIVIIVVVGSVMETVRQYLKKSERGSAAADKKYHELQEIIKKQDERLSNLETVILDLSSEKKYRDL
jgi:hypothetical protein